MTDEDQEIEAKIEKINNFVDYLSEGELEMLAYRVAELFPLPDVGRPAGRSADPYHVALDRAALNVRQAREAWLNENASAKRAPVGFVKDLIESEIMKSALLSAKYETDTEGKLEAAINDRISDRKLVGE